ETDGVAILHYKMPILPCNTRREGDFTCPNDCISQLPYEILVDVLSCLSMKEAARTTILSSRWRYLWNSFTGCLNFEKPLTMAYLEAKAHLGLEAEPLARERFMFMSWVNQVLGSHHGQLMEGLRICFDVDYNNNDIDKWVQFAVEKKVQKLELDFSGVRYDCYERSSGQYTFPSHLFRCSSFRSLTSLRLANVGVSGEVLEHLLSYCTVEALSVKESLCLTSLKLFGPSLKLKYLELKSCTHEFAEEKESEGKYDGKRKEMEHERQLGLNLQRLCWKNSITCYFEGTF
ncbi:hypothetical protein CUMW_240580, partial [Citrus unshiu]